MSVPVLGTPRPVRERGQFWGNLRTLAGPGTPLGTPGRRPGVPRPARGFRDWFLHPDRPRGFRDWLLRGWRDPKCGLRVWPL